MKSIMHIVLCLVVSGSCIAETWTVDDDGKADFNNIQAAVDAAVDGDEIIVMPGTYTSTQDGHVVNMLGKAVTLRSSDPTDPDVVAATIIDGEDSRRGLACFNAESASTIIEGLTIMNGRSVPFDYSGDDNSSWEDCGGGMINYLGSNPSISKCIFTDNFTYDDGGGIYNYLQSSPTISFCTFTNNTAQSDGGGIYNGSGDCDPIITSCEFLGNSAYRGGAIASSNSNQVLNDCIFFSNSASNGGAIYNYQNNQILTNCIIENNFASYRGGAIYNQNGPSQPVFINCEIKNNIANTGGGVYNCCSSGITLTNSWLCGNVPENIFGPWIDGGGGCIAFSCQDTNGDGIPDKCQNPGGNVLLVPQEYPTIQDAINAAVNTDEILVASGVYTGTGDSVINTYGKKVWIHSSNGPEKTVIHGEGVRTGIICTSGETNKTIFEGFTISDCRSSRGRGMYCSSSDPTVKDCIFENNFGSSDGGALYLYSSEPLIENCIFNNNSTSGYGGAISQNYGGQATIRNCSIKQNTAVYGGGAATTYSGLLLINTVVCDNTPDQMFGPWTNNGDACVAYSCADDNGDTIPDNCQRSQNSILLVPEDYLTIQDAINASIDGDEIIVGPGTYTSLDTDVIRMTDQAVWIHSSDGPELTFIDGEDSRRGVMCANSGVILEGFTVTNCSLSGMRNYFSDPMVRNCYFIQNYNEAGGGVYNRNSSPTFQNCVFQGNIATAGNGGGIHNYYSGPIVENCEFNSNEAVSGGALSTEGGGAHFIDVTITDSIFTNNVATDSGGAILFASANSSGHFIQNSRINNNSASVVGGGISTYNWDFDLLNSTICGNFPDQVNGSFYLIGECNNVREMCDCPDVNCDSEINIVDVLAVLDQWGEMDSFADFSFDGIVDVSDILVVISNWGPCE